MANDLINVNAFKKGPSAAFASLDPKQESLADGIGQSYGVLHYKGKVWSLKYRGQNHIFTRKDDGTPISYIDIVVIGQAPYKSKSFYSGYDPNDDGGKRPVCASINGITPDVDVQQKQADTCALCPRNVWKTDARGKKTKDCSDYKRLAVLLMPAITQSMLGHELLEPVFLRVPPASLNGLAQLGEQMDAQGYHYSTYITRVSFDPQEPHPKMVFKAHMELTDTEAPIVLSLRQDVLVKRIVEGDVTLPRLTAPVATATAAPTEAPTGFSPSTVSAPPAAQNGATLATVASVASPSLPESDSGGFGTVTLAAGPKPPLQNGNGINGTVTATSTETSDTGEPQFADADLNARIDALMAAKQ